MTIRYALYPVIALIALPGVAALAENRINTQRPDAPELAAYGDLPVGVRQIELSDPGRIDILAIDPAADKPAQMPTYDRPLTVEVWYPAAADATGSTTFQTYLRDGTTEVDVEGRAMRDAAPAQADEPYPLVLVSHGYPGNRFLMSHLAENIASKGYVVAAWGAPHGTLAIHQAGSDSHEQMLDPRIKTAVAFGPWGMNTGFWDAEGLKGVQIPMLFIAGSQDETSLYEKGVRAICSPS